MPYFIVALIILAIIGLTAAARRRSGPTAVPGSGNLISQIKPIDGFSRVNVGNAFHVDIYQAQQHNVTITTDDNVIDRVEVAREGDTLRIGLESGDYQDATLIAKIGMPRLEAVLLSGATRCSLAGFSSGDDISMRLSGASSLEGRIEARNGDLRLSGASSVKLSGSAEGFSIRGSGASSMDLADFPVVRAEVSLSGACKATMVITEVIDEVELSGASNLSYQGEPTIKEVRTLGASTIRRV